MRQYRTTDDGVHFFWAPQQTPTQETGEQPGQVTDARAAEHFRQMRIVIDDSRLVTPEELQD